MAARENSVVSTFLLIGMLYGVQAAAVGSEYGNASGKKMAADEMGGSMTSSKDEYGGGMMSSMEEYGGGMGSSSSGSGRAMESGESTMKDRIYTFAFCGESKPYHFIDQESGQLMGFGVDMVMEACAVANKMCAPVYVMDMAECWDSMDRRSRGLNDRWYDSVVNMMETATRGLSYSFVGKYATEPMAHLYARMDASFNAVDTTKHKVGFVNGLWLSPMCMKMKNMMPSQVMYMKDYDELMAALDDGKIDVAFMEESMAEGYKEVSSLMQCAKSGPSMMARKDMEYQLYWMEDALREVFTSGKYNRMCYIAKKAYGGDPMCMMM